MTWKINQNIKIPSTIVESYIFDGLSTLLGNIAFVKLWDKYSKSKARLTDEEKLHEDVELSKFVNNDPVNGVKTTTYYMIYAGNDVVVSERISYGARTDIRAVVRLSRIGYQDFVAKLDQYNR